MPVAVVVQPRHPQQAGLAPLEQFKLGNTTGMLPVGFLKTIKIALQGMESALAPPPESPVGKGGPPIGQASLPASIVAEPDAVSSVEVNIEVQGLIRSHSAEVEKILQIEKAEKAELKAQMARMRKTMQAMQAQMAATAADAIDPEPASEVEQPVAAEPASEPEAEPASGPEAPKKSSKGRIMSALTGGSK